MGAERAGQPMTLRQVYAGMTDATLTLFEILPFKLVCRIMDTVLEETGLTLTFAL